MLTIQFENCFRSNRSDGALAFNSIYAEIFPELDFEIAQLVVEKGLVIS